MELGINVGDEMYCVDKPAKDYIVSDYYFLLDPKNNSKLVEQIHIDPMFDIKTDMVDGTIVNYVGISQQPVEFGRSSSVRE